MALHRVPRTTFNKPGDDGWHMIGTDPLGAKTVLETASGQFTYFRLGRLEEMGYDLRRLPYSIKVLLEALLRQADNKVVTEEHVLAVAGWSTDTVGRDVPFIPARVILQDFTGVPAVVDLAAMRTSMAARGGDPSKVNPIIPADLVIDHSVQVDAAGTCLARGRNEALEMERNRERYQLLKWAQQAFDNLRVIPPGNGIIHQVNLEHLAPLVHDREVDGIRVAFPDSVFGTDSHTTQINGLGVLGWGVGGIEAEAVMLGQPYYMPIPEVIGMRLTGTLGEGITATDLVLTVVEMLRKHGVVGKFVEFFGPGLEGLDLPDRATLANMGPEYGATTGFFPVDRRTIEYLRLTGRGDRAELVESYCKAQGLWYDHEPEYTNVLELDLGLVVPSLAGHKRPQDRIPLSGMREAFNALVGEDRHSSGQLCDGSVVIASITSCTNTSNPMVMVAAGLLAKKAVERGLRPASWVKTSLSPGSRVVTDYLDAAGLTPYLEAMGFHLTGYGCMTCIGNSGPLRPEIAKTVLEKDLTVAAVVSANRNFEGRVHALVKANYLASPPLVVAFAIAGRVDVDLDREPLGCDPDGGPVYLHDIWPSNAEIEELVRRTVKGNMFSSRYADVFSGSELWEAIKAPVGELFQWDDGSTYIREPPFFEDLELRDHVPDIMGARALAVLGNSITTDHISPAGSIPEDGPAGRYLTSKGVDRADFNSFGSRRGNHEVMMRGAFANIRLRNALSDREGGWSRYLPAKEDVPLFEASQLYVDDGVPLVVLAGREYGTGSSRDWAAKGPYLLGVKAVIAESFERIHRSNLIGMGVVPLQFRNGESAISLGLEGTESYDIHLEGLEPRSNVRIVARKGDAMTEFEVIARIDAPIEMEYLYNGGILRTVLLNMLGNEDI